MWDFPKLRGTLFWGPYNKDPAIKGIILGSPMSMNGVSGLGFRAQRIMATECDL